MVRDGGYGGGFLRRMKPYMSKAVRAAPGMAAAIDTMLVAPATAVRDLAISLGAGVSRGGKLKGGSHGGSVLAGRRK